MSWVDIQSQWTDNASTQWYQNTSSGTLSAALGLWQDDLYVYTSFSGVLNILELESEMGLVSINTALSLNSVCADSFRVYIATEIGLKYILKTEISSTMTSANIYNFTRFVYGSDIKSVHCNDDYIMACSTLGVSVVKQKEVDTIYTTTSNAKKCFVAKNKFYYSIENTPEWSLNYVSLDFYNWSEPDYSYTTGSGVLASGTLINDFSVSDNQTIIVAMDSDLVIIDNITKVGRTLATLFPTTASFTSAHIDKNASYNFGRAYATYKTSTDEAFVTLDLKTDSIIDFYSQTRAGSTNEYLTSASIVDVVVGGVYG